MDIVFITTLLFIFIGVIELLLSIPLILKKIKPNTYFGFRTKQTKTNTALWYNVNKRFGASLLGSGLVLIISMILLMQYPLTIMDTLLTGLILLFLTLLTSLLYGLLYIRRISH